MLRDVDVLPGVQYARCDVLENGGGYLASGLIQYVREVVLGEQGVGGIGAVRIGPGFVLMLARRVNNTRRTGLERFRGSTDERSNEWSKK